MIELIRLLKDYNGYKRKKDFLSSIVMQPDRDIDKYYQQQKVCKAACLCAI